MSVVQFLLFTKEPLILDPTLFQFERTLDLGSSVLKKLCYLPFQFQTQFFIIFCKWVFFQIGSNSTNLPYINTKPNETKNVVHWIF